MAKVSPLTFDQAHQACEMWENGETQAGIARKLGTQPSYVHQELRQAFKLQPRSPWFWRGHSHEVAELTRFMRITRKRLAPGEAQPAERLPLDRYAPRDGLGHVTYHRGCEPFCPTCGAAFEEAEQQPWDGYH